ncbi:MAG: hypothetical protein J7494_02630 [Sphingobium sp.]|nr:hypothetical protein [Sphingobium sp.]
MMRHRITSLHPATAAIVAALALSTTPVLAQPVDEAAQPAAPVAEPAPAPEAAPAEVVPTPALPQVQAAVPAPSQATEVVQQTPATPPTAAPAERAPQVTQRAAPAPAPARPAAAPASSARPATPAAPPALATPQTRQAPATTDLAPVTETTPAMTPETVTPPVDPKVLWTLGGALLLVGGVSAFALARSKSPSEARVEMETAPVSTAEPAPVADRPVAVSFRPAHRAPGLAPQPASSRADYLSNDLEAMVAAPPSLENPFLTRKKRLRRAKYILAHGMPEPLHGDAEPIVARVEDKQFRPQPAYSFSKAQNPPRFGWKPATS